MTQQHMIIVLHSTDIDWALLSDTGETIQTGIHSTLAEASEFAKNKYITVIAPAEDVLLTQVTLPKLNRQRLMQALPYALEEQLIDDVHHLHFAIGEYQADESLPVAVVAKSKMQHWREALRAAHIETNIMIPATLALPYEENHWEIYSFDETNIVRTGLYSGFAADNGTLDHLLELKLAEIPEKNSIRITRHKNASSLLFFKNIPEDHVINLLQGEFPAKRKSTQTKSIWKYAGYLAAAWIVCLLLSNLISLVLLQHQASRLEDSMKEIYYRQFPKATSMVAPRERLTTKLKESTNAAQKNNFLSLLATVSKVITKTTGIRLLNLDFRNGQLTLEISSAAFDNLDTLTNELNQQGLTVKQQNAATFGSQVKATLLINAGAA